MCWLKTDWPWQWSQYSYVTAAPCLEWRVFMKCDISVPQHAGVISEHTVCLCCNLQYGDALLMLEQSREQRCSPELSYGETRSFIFLCCLHMFAKNMSESFHLTVSWPDVCSSLGIAGIFLFSSNPNNCWRQQGLFGPLQVMEQHYCLWRAWIAPQCDFFVTIADLFVLFYMAALLQVSNSLNDTRDTCSYIASGANPMFQPSHRVVGCIHSSLWMCRWAEQILESFKCSQCFLLLSLGLLIYAAWVFPVAGCLQKWCTSANRSSHRGPGSLCSYTQV